MPKSDIDLETYLSKLDKKRNEKLVLRAWDKLYTYVSLEKTYNPDRTWTAMQM